MRMYEVEKKAEGSRAVSLARQHQDEGKKSAGEEGVPMRYLYVGLAQRMPQSGTSQCYFVPRLQEAGDITSIDGLGLVATSLCQLAASYL